MSLFGETIICILINLGNKKFLGKITLEFTNCLWTCICLMDMRVRESNISNHMIIYVYDDLVPVYFFL